MSMNLLTGKAGTNHVTSGDMGAMQAAVFGAGNYLLPTADGSFPNVVMKDSNTISVPVMNMVLEGRFARVTAAETVKVSSGVTGKKRNDLLCIKYSRDGQNIESISFVVLSGASVESNPSDPTVPAGSILGRASTAYVPVARIPIDGINVGKPVMLLSRRGSLWDSVSLTRPNANWKVDYRTAVIGKMLIVAFQANRLNTNWNAAKEWEVSQLFTLPAGFEAAFEVHCAAVSNSTMGLHGVEVQAAGNAIALRSAGKMTINSNGGWVEGCITVPLQ